MATWKRIIMLALLAIHSLLSLAQNTIRTAELDDTNILFIMEHCEFAFAKDSLDPPENLTWFESNHDRYQNFGRPKTKLWMRFTVKNTTDALAEPVFVFGNHTINEVTLYEQTAVGMNHLYTTGSGHPFSSRPYPFFVFAFPLELAPGQTKEYVASIDSKGELMMFIPLMLHPVKLKDQNDRSYMGIGIYGGVLLLCSVFNLFLFALVRERIHLLYGVYALVAIWCLLSMETMDFQFLFPDHPQWIYPNRFSSNFLYFVFLLLIMQQFLGQTTANSRFYWPARILVGLNLAAFVLEWVFGLPRWPAALSDIHYRVLQTLHLLNLLVILLSCMEKIRQGVRLAWLFLTAIMAMVVGGLLTILNTWGVLNWHVLLMPPTPLATGVVLEAVIICFGILYRYYLLKREKERLSLELQDQKLIATKEILRVEEDEKRRFARNLHDELGGNLAALKVAVQRLDKTEPLAQQLILLVDRTSDATRTIAHDIMPPDFEQTELDRLLAAYFRRLSQNSRTRFVYHGTMPHGLFSKQQELLVYRMLLELSTNIMKHAKANLATVQLLAYEDNLEIMVEDNGIGFDPITQKKGMGLKNIDSRVHFFGGVMDIDSSEKGTTIIIKLPTDRK